MRFLSLFAGIGGFELGLERQGHRCAGQIEIDPFCRRVLERHWSHIPRWPDVREWKSNGDEYSSFFPNESDRSARADTQLRSDGQSCSRPPTGSVDLLCGGFPCQDLSVAGKRAGLSGERSGLFWEIVRIAKEVKPQWGLFENVPGLLSSHHGRDMWTVLNGLRECWPIVGYRVLDSQYFGVAQRRRRVFFVCGPTESGVREILFESASSSGDFAPSGETGKRVAATLRSRTVPPSGHMAGRGGEDDMNLIVNCFNGYTGGPDDNDAQGSHLVAGTLTSGFTTKGHGRAGVNDQEIGKLIPQNGVRRLTPIECARLQGFPDDWLCLCQQIPCVCPDGPQYRALGNAVTVNVIEWFGKQFRTEGAA